MTNKSILLKADELIHGERVAKYGDARETFGNVARIFSLITKTDLSGEHVALLQLILKLVRNSHSPENIDHLTDAAGYIGLMSEIQQAELVKPASQTTEVRPASEFTITSSPRDSSVNFDTIPSPASAFP